MRPYLSFVFAARNDDHGGDLLHRMGVCFRTLLGLLREHGPPAELVLVEWNPPGDRPALRHALEWPPAGPAVVRLVRVPRPLHDRFPNADRMPMFEYIAKNVGIRRAEGRYVLATNPDLVFSEELIRYLGSERLSEECFYRIDRYDVADRVPADVPLAEQLRHCARRAFRVATIRGTVPVERFPRGLLRAARGGLSALRRVARPSRPYPDAHDGMHTNASGDFLLMAAGRWGEIRGYPEFPSHSFIDGYPCYQAAALGLRQVVLGGRLRIYHQEHDRSAHEGRPLTDYGRYVEDGRRMLEAGRPEVYNGEDWGLGGEPLPEERIA